MPLGPYQMHHHLNYRGSRRRRGKERVWENFWRDYSWIYPQHGKGNSQSSPRGTKSPIKDNPRRNTPRHILIKLRKTKHKERILKAAREKQKVTYKGNPICLTADFSAETLQARRQWQDMFKVLEGENLQPRVLYPERISFSIDGKIKRFSDKKKLREFSTTKPDLQQMLKRLIQPRNTREEKKVYKIIPKQLRKQQ